MKYRNPSMKKIKNTRPLLVSCNLCKTALLTYQKGGRGNLIKIQFPRIVESNFILDEKQKGFFCPHCQEHLGSLRSYKGNPAYYLIRGLTSSKELSHYKY